MSTASVLAARALRNAGTNWIANRRRVVYIEGPQVQAGLNVSAVIFPENTLQGVAVATLTPINCSNPSAIILSSISPANAIQIAGDGRTVQAGSAAVNFEVNTTVTAMAYFTHATGAFFGPITLAVTNVGPPAQMVEPTVGSPTATSLLVTRAADPFSGAAITGYKLRYAPDASTWFEVTMSSNPQTISGLLSSTTYSVQTAAISSEGQGPWSPATLGTTSASGSPTDVTGPLIQNVALLPDGTFTAEMVEADSYPVTVYALVNASPTALTYDAIKAAVDAATSLAYGSVSVTAPGAFTINLTTTNMTTGSAFRLHLAGKDNANNKGSDSVFGPFDYDAGAPVISSTTPVDNATGVATSSSISVVFDRPIQFGTGNITLRKNTGSFVDDEVFDVVTEQGTADGQVTISGNTLTINPTALLDNTTEYAIRIASGAIKNMSGIAFGGVANDTTISFTTGGAGSLTLVDTKVAGAAGADQVTVAKPTGTISGDRLLIRLAQRGGDRTYSISGFTVLGSVAEFTTGAMRITYYQKTAGGSEPSTYTATEDGNQTADMEIAISAFRNCSGFGTPQGEWNFSPTTTPNNPGFSVGAGSMSDIFWGCGGGRTWSNPSGSPIGTGIPSSASVDNRMCVAVYGPHSAGTTPDRTATLSSADGFIKGRVEVLP